MALLEIDQLQIGFDTEAGLVRAVDGVSMAVEAGRTVGLVGESGCGKSVTAASVLRLVPSPPGVMLGGEIRFDGRDILQLPHEALRELRGREIAMVFQDPMTSLNPVFTIERQLWEVLRLRFGLDRTAARQRSAEMLRTVGIADPDARLDVYPHELSGGMKQRVMIAMALLCEPRLLIADEPTTALDVTVQAQILHLMRELQRRFGTALLFITHDMGVIAEMCDDVVVMYAGRVVERKPVQTLFDAPAHPYTQGLLGSIPRRGLAHKGELPTIEGTVPSLLNPPQGCRFADRCRHRSALDASAQQRCRNEDPPMRSDGAGLVACHFPLRPGVNA
ncbi:MAG: ABC transporter ATP-binding protein [Betaproteobacteria bacterium]|jgi:peptide/nickel transport system ATP-binding protein|nr:ABC transporter ATP-binding protein [Burkholderiaceae bacterium]MCZ8110179.1 ABC transporter ATP-binding protein [Rubrivivax sp.]MCZ8177291.1 ABC transporter ATP-binding protein [Burkholderiaceae bacterium]